MPRSNRAMSRPAAVITQTGAARLGGDRPPKTQAHLGAGARHRFDNPAGERAVLGRAPAPSQASRASQVRQPQPNSRPAELAGQIRAQHPRWPCHRRPAGR